MPDTVRLPLPLKEGVRGGEGEGVVERKRIENDINQKTFRFF